MNEQTLIPYQEKAIVRADRQISIANKAIFRINTKCAIGQSNLARRAIQDMGRLTTDPHVSELISTMVSSSDWKDRELAWIELRKMGPTYRGWVESLRKLIYTGDGWSRIFSAEALSCFSCNLEDAVPVLTATIEACLDQKDYGWGRLACAALGNFKVIDRKLVEGSITCFNSCY